MFVTGSVADVLLRQDSTVCIRGMTNCNWMIQFNILIICVSSGAATTASRLGQPDLAIATLNDFVQSAQMMCSLDPQMPVIADADTGLASLP